MSELINNLNTIYNAKLAIKQAIGTESDNLLDYASYISAMAPQGTSYLTTNGLYDISTYAMVNVNVPQGGGGVDYQWIDWSTSPVLTQGDKVSFNGYLGSGEQVTQEIINLYPPFADYLGWYLYPVGGWDRTISGTTPWEKYVLSENQLSISQNTGVVVYGEIVDITMGSATQKITILEDINETKFAGGNGTKDITTNGTQLVVGYQSVSVNVQAQSNHDGLTEATAFTVEEAIEFINTLDPNTPTTDMYYVKGRISQVIYTIDSRFNTWRGYISNDGTTTNQLLVYGNGYDADYQTVNWDENVNPQVKRGDSVIVYAYLQLYNNVPQTNNGYLDNHQRRVEGSPVNPITANGVVDVQDYVSVNVNIPDSEFDVSKLTTNPSPYSLYLRITNTSTNETTYYEVMDNLITDFPIHTINVKLYDIVNYCFPNISTNNLIINLVQDAANWYYNDTVGGALFGSNFVAPLLLEAGSSTDSFITDIVLDTLSIGVDMDNNSIYIWNAKAQGGGPSSE